MAKILDANDDNSINKINYISKKEIYVIAEKYFKEKVDIEKYFIEFASENMLGFLCDYLKLNVHVISPTGGIQILNCFIKAISKSNSAKAAMVTELKLYEKESRFYSMIKEAISITGIAPWSPKMIVALEDTMVFENITFLGYQMRNKLLPFDEAHTLQALRTLARFHASTMIYEEKSINKSMDFKNLLNKGGYDMKDPWYLQCMHGALDVIKTHSKYTHDKNIIRICERKWRNVWQTALDLTDPSTIFRNVICHRDLWNNNLMFKYESGVPTDCLLVDFQAARYHPPAGDVMVLFYCNLETVFRERIFDRLLSFYYSELDDILQANGVDNFTFQELKESANYSRLWGLISSACLVPQFWISDELTTKIFTDSNQFREILCNDKGSFIRRMCDENYEYRHKVLGIFEEIVDKYVLREPSL